MHLNASRSQKAKITVTLSNDLVHQIDKMLDSPEAGSRNQCENDVIVVPLSTTLRVAPRHVELPAGEGGLKEPSMAKCEQASSVVLLLEQSALRSCEKSKQPTTSDRDRSMKGEIRGKRVLKIPIFVGDR